METLSDYLKSNKPKGFCAEPFYSSGGDSLVIYFKEARHYAERVDSFLTVYRSIENDELVGAQVKGLARLLDEIGDFDLLIENDGVKLSLIFVLCMLSSRTASSRACYQQLGRAAKHTSMSRRQLAPLLS
jgi:hypothetical protein